MDPFPSSHAWLVVGGFPQFLALWASCMLASSERERETPEEGGRGRKTEVTITYNLILEETSYPFYCILCIRSDSLALTYTQGRRLCNQ
jgi:hypothetical protein